MTRALPFGWQQFVAGFQGDVGPSILVAVLGRLLLRPQDHSGLCQERPQYTDHGHGRRRREGGFDENAETWRLTSKKATTCTWTGPSADEFNLFLNGYFLDTWLEKKRWCSTQVQAVLAKKLPIVLKITRQADAKYRPFERHLARCSAWPQSLEEAICGAHLRYMPPRREAPGGTST